MIDPLLALMKPRRPPKPLGKEARRIETFARTIRLVDFVNDYPNATAREIKEHMNVSMATAFRWRRSLKIARGEA